MRKGVAIQLILLVLLFGISFWSYDLLPTDVATHFNASGAPDGYSPKGMGVLFTPLMAVFIFLLMYYLPSLSTDKDRDALLRMRSMVDGIGASLLFFIFFVQCYLIAWNLGYKPPLSLIAVPLGLLFAYLGWLMPHMEQNYLMGIRLPWTLADKENWRRTHLVAGKLFFAAGLVSMASLLIPNWAFGLIIVPVMLAVLLSIGYSFWLYRHSRRGESTRKSKKR